MDLCLRCSAVCPRERLRCWPSRVGDGGTGSITSILSSPQEPKHSRCCKVATVGERPLTIGKLSVSS